jgi:toxin CcdB
VRIALARFSAVLRLPQFDVQNIKSGGGLVLDCQSDLLEQLDTRLVVPLIPTARAPTAAKRLNPIFLIDGKEHVMVTQFAAAVHRRELGEVVTSLRNHSFEIVGALDVLVSGV